MHQELTSTTLRLSRRLVVLVVSSVLVALLVVWAVATRGRIADADATTTRHLTGTVTTRTLAATSEVDGTVQRASRFQVAYGSTGAALVPDGSAGERAASGTNQSANSVANVSSPSSGGADIGGADIGGADIGTATLATTSLAVMQVAFTSPVAMTPTPTLQPGATPSRTPTPSPDPSPDPSPYPSATRGPKPSPTPAPTSGPTPRPSPGPSATSAGPGGGQPTGGAGQVPGGTSAPTGSPSGGVAGPVPGGASAATGSPQAASTSGGTANLPAATLTKVAGLGTRVKAGTVLYAADGQPVVALLGDSVFWRDLEVGVSDGEDVRVLEENLAAMGYGGGLTVDSSFTSVTASAVERWQADLGLSDPNGTVTLGAVVVVGSATEVSAQLSQMGDALRTGGGILTLSSVAQIVAAQVTADAVTAWRSGTAVTLTWSDGTTAAAKVVSMGRDVVDGTVAITVASDRAGAARVSGTPVTMSLTIRKAERALAVPVAAIRSGKAGGSAVLVLDGSTERGVAVTTGIVADGWVEVSGELVEGQDVVLPG